jgi:hypothetical protein
MLRSVGLCLVFACVLVLPRVADGQDELRIENVGLEGFYGGGLPTPVRVYIPALDDAQTIEVHFVVDSGRDPKHRQLKRTDRFSQTIQMERGEAREIDSPILIPTDAWVTLSVSAASANGGVIGEADQELKSIDGFRGGENLFAVFCVAGEPCSQAQSQIAFGTDSNVNTRGRDFRLVVLPRFLNDWWGYGRGRALVLAAPMTNVTEGQRLALEEYLRAGGTLVLAEKEIQDKEFLEEYGGSKPGPIRVGRGVLYRVASVDSKALGPVTTDILKAIGGVENPIVYSGGPESYRLLEQVGVTFKFPRLRWLILWISAYLLVVGPLNFAVLHRMKRLEWGWISICAISVVFAVGLYLASGRGRPNNFTLDDASVYWMDGISGLAGKDVAIRVSSPERTPIQEVVDDDLVVASTLMRIDSEGPSGLDFGAEMTDKPIMTGGWDMRLGRPFSVNINMQRWSFQDLRLEGFQKFPGSVHWLTAAHLKNDTGISFREALYIDNYADKEYLFSPFAAGSEIDLTRTESRPHHIEISALPDGTQRSQKVENCPGDGPRFSAVNLRCAAISSQWAKHLFVGVADGPVPDTRLDVPFVIHAQVAVVVVDLDQR